MLHAHPVGADAPGSVEAAGFKKLFLAGDEAGDAASLAVADLDDAFGRPVVSEFLVELGRGPDLLRREVVLAGQAVDVPVADVSLPLVKLRELVVDGLSVTQKLVLEGDQVLAHG